NNQVSIIPIQTSFDPHSGFLYMGLETDEALRYVSENGGEYTEKVLQDLVRKGKVLSTLQLIGDLQLDTVFLEHIFPLDWKAKYVESAGLFWKNISTFKESVLPAIEEKVKEVFLHL